MERITSFNPEAAAFVFSSTSPQEIALAPNTSSIPPQDADFPLAMAPMFNCEHYPFSFRPPLSNYCTTDSPFHDAGSARSLYRRDPPTPAPVRLEDFFSTHEDDMHDIRAPQIPKPAATPTKDNARIAKHSLPPFTFLERAPKPQPAYAPVDINELSAGLGLPSAKAEINEETLTIESYESEVPQAHSGALYGKLIGLALDKPLNAKGLAEFLQKQDVGAPLHSPKRGGTRRTPILAEHNPSETTPTKSRLPSSREILDHLRGSARDAKTPTPCRVAIPSPPETITRTKRRDSAAHHQHRRNSSATSYRQHNRVPSHRYPRRTSRAKRSDQGPMPSAADIYPDDAHWTPSAPLYETAHDYVSYQEPQQAPEPPHIVVANPFDWPPPAQVYAPEAPPTLTDIYEADAEVLELMNQLPAPSLSTLAKLGNTHDIRTTSTFGLESAGLKGDERALTPGQEDGSRYGIRFWGIGFGDSWDLPRIGELEEGMFGGEAFRVRPREHEGWGGLQWALAKGCKY
ncbi:hypothetical protein E8E11_009347 [Didymella keratinophila]|nr:hypothetical protein E8E11_009347 [Didymella keratinophila]